MESEVKILFTSDIHLGFNNDELNIPEMIRISTFKKITALAKNHDLMVIAGDLIDRSNIDRSSIELIKSEFRHLRDNNTEIIYTPGINDLNSDGSLPPSLFDFNVSYLFSNPEFSYPYLYEKDAQKIYFYGIPASNGYDISEINKVSDDGFHMGLFHVDIDLENDKKDSSIFSLQKKDFRSLELDFYALGCNHNFKIFKVSDRIVGAYPGSPEATSFNETGDRYVLSLNIKDNEISHIKRVTVNSMKVVENFIDCTDINTNGRIIDIIRENRSLKTVQKLLLTGKRDFILNYEEINSYTDEFYDLIITDNSTPSINSLIEEFGQEDSIRGEFFKVLKKRVEQNEIPDEIEWDDLLTIIKHLINNELDSLEEWICNSSNA